MREPDAKIALADPDAEMEPEERDQRQLQRHDEERDDERDEERAAGEIHPGQRIGREGRDQDRDDGGRDRHRQRVEEGLGHVVLARPAEQDRAVVLDRELGRRLRRDEDPLAPPARLLDAGEAVGAVLVQHEGLAVAGLGHLARREGVDRAGGDAEGPDRRARGQPARILDEIALDHPDTVLLHGGLGATGADLERLFGREERGPPARGRDLVRRPEGRHEKPDRGEDPQEHEEHDRDVDRPGQARLCAGDVVHQRISFRAL
jgi:hypothetical protein